MTATLIKEKTTFELDQFDTDPRNDVIPSRKKGCYNKDSNAKAITVLKRSCRRRNLWEANLVC